MQLRQQREHLELTHLTARPHDAPRVLASASLALLVAGLALGFAIRSPGLGWLGLVLTAWAVSRSLDRPYQLAGLLLASSLIASLLRYGFVWRGLRLFGAGADASWGALLLGVSSGLVERWPIVAVVLGAPRRWRPLLARATPLWLPPAWLLGELGMASVMNMELNGWLLTQAQAGPVVRLVSWLGQTPTALAAMTVGAAAGTSIAHRRWSLLATSLALAVAAFAVPPRVTDARGLRGVAALRLQRRADQVRGLDADLVVWPETVSTRPVSLDEGPVELRVTPPSENPSIHIMGIVNQRGDRQQNSAIAVTHDGRVFWHRAKTALAAVGEVTRFGLRIGGNLDLLPGTIEPVVQLGERRVGVLICSEVLDRTMRERATPEGVELLVVLAGDAITGDQPSGRQLMLNAAILAAAEQGVSVARASSRGVAALIGPDGTVYADVEEGHLRAATLPRGAP